MTKNPHVRSALAQAALKFSPPLVRESLLNCSDFRTKYGLATDGIISFKDSDVSIRRSDLFRSVRTVLGGKSEETVSDTNGREWKLRYVSEKADDASEKPTVPLLALSWDDRQTISFSEFAVLSPDQEIRLRFLAEGIADVNLPSSASERWRYILAKRELEDDEVDKFHSEFRDTPVAQARVMQGEISAGKISISSLVPPSRRYYERLVGAYDGSTTIRDYAAGNGRVHFDRLSSWKPYDGFLYSLYLSSHFSLTSEIKVDKLSNEALVHALEYLYRHGDRISQLGAIEIGFRVLSAMPEIESILLSLVKLIRDDDKDGDKGGFGLVSALFCFVDGELSRTRLFSSEPPFYRRLASLSQAGMIQRQLVSSGIDADQISAWAVNNRGGQFFLQSLVDMRMEPRWNPHFSDSERVRAHFCRRIINAVMNADHDFRSSRLSDVILSTDKEGLLSPHELYFSFLPGPLEGGEASNDDVPSDISESIESQLEGKEVGSLSFVSLVNSASIFRIGEHEAELAVKALKRSQHKLRNIGDRSELFTIIHGIASVAAVTRSHDLADELKILVRGYRRDPEFQMSIHEAVSSCLVAAASRTDLEEWRQFVGKWLTELSFGDLSAEEGERLHSYIRCLCEVVPELWVSCGRADAALMAYIGRE